LAKRYWYNVRPHGLAGSVKMLEAIPRHATSAKGEQNAEDEQRDCNLGNILLRTQSRNGGSDNPKTQDGRPKAEGAHQKVFCFHVLNV
jgi:hypothetical protein